MQKRGFATYFLTAVIAFICAAVRADDPVFYNLNDMFDISLRETTSVITDRHGFVWVSSKTGVLRATDDSYRRYEMPYTTPDVFTLKLVASPNELYAYTNNGQIFIYDEVSDRFKLVLDVRDELDIRFLTVSNMVVDANGTMCLATSRGLIKYNPIDRSILMRFSEIMQVERYSGESLVVARRDGLYVLNNDAVITDTLINTRSLFPRVMSLYYHADKAKVWIGTESSGLLIFDPKDSKLHSVQGIPWQPVLVMEQVSDTTMMIGIDGQGLWEVQSDTYEIINIYKYDIDRKTSLSGNGVYDIHMDKETGRIWVCTFGGGASYFSRELLPVQLINHIPNSPNSLTNNEVNEVLEDAKGNLWFATSNGISRWNPVTDTWTSLYQNHKDHAEVFLSLCEDADGNIWAGSYASGVYLLDGRTGRELAHFHTDRGTHDFNNNFVFDIYRDSRDNIWIVGVRGDIMCYERSTRTFRNFGEYSVHVIRERSESEMILGVPHGLSLLDTRTGNTEILLSGYLVHDLFLLGDDVWMCTVGGGLVRFNLNTREVMQYTSEAGLPSNFLNSIIYLNGSFWLGTENGVCRFDPGTAQVETFPSGRNLSGMSYNRGAVSIKVDGQLIWGTNQGAVLFDPSRVSQSNSKGKIYVQDILVLGQSIRTGISGGITIPVDNIRNLELNHIHNSLNFEVLPLGEVFGARFSWFLEGIDEDWSTPSGNRTMNYTNLPSGTYKLHIKMYDNSLSTLIDQRIITIVKHPPFWESPWFLVIVSFVLLSAFYFSLKYHINLITQLHSEEKIRFFANTAHDMRSSLTLIKAPIEELSKENLSDKGKRFLDIARDQVAVLSAVISDLMDFQKIDVGKEKLVLKKLDLPGFFRKRIAMFDTLALSGGLEISFKTNVEEYISSIDEGKMGKIIDNLLSNAIKYSLRGGQIEVIFNGESSGWKLSVTDHGMGISKNAQKLLFREFYRADNAVNSRIVGSGIGLLLTKKYVVLHGGKISCESEINKGSTFTISIPYNNEVTEIAAGEEPKVSIIAQEEDQEKSAGRYSVMIVEDNRDLLDFLKEALEDEFTVMTAGDGMEALKIVEEKQPDLVVSDVVMPNMGGFEFCKALKSDYETSHIPVILLTALSDRADQMRGLGLGADDYLIKPFDSTLLKQKIISIINNRIKLRDKLLMLVKDELDEPILSNELNDKFVKRALKVVKDNMSNRDFNKESFAYEMNVSSSLLYKKIKSLTGQSPTDFIRVIRLTHAYELLKSQNLTVTEVSELCGFSSIGYFSTVFRKYYGKAPSDIPKS